MSVIFVFGSNLAGRHGAGSALAAAANWGAIAGVGRGLQGQSYAIPTKDYDLRVLNLIRINKEVAEFIYEAWRTPSITYRIVDIGCGLAGYKPVDIAPMFHYAPANCIFIGQLHNLLKDRAK